ncbi:MAG TPA: FHA domain-containing protein [Kofleriaceae bacterium]|jgi:hypothetical protein
MTRHKLTHCTRWLLVAATLLAIAGPVHADGSSVEVLLQIKPPDKNNPKTRDDAPQIEATVIGAPNLPSEKFVLRDDSVKQSIEVKPSTKRDYNQGSETLAVVIVMNGSELWLGNDDIPAKDDDPIRCPGVLKPLKDALDKLSFKDAGPPGSLGMVITYADKIIPKIPMGALANITGSALGQQVDYRGAAGLELVQGIEAALAELHKVQTARKVLIVVGDGRDINPEAAKSRLGVLKKQAVQDQIQTFAIVYKTCDVLAEQQESPIVINAMVQQVMTANGADNIASSIQSILARMADRQYLTFPGFDPKLGLGFTWDGKPHNMILKIDKEDAEPVSLNLAPIWHPSKGGFPWLVVIIIVLGAAVLAVIGIKIFSAKPAPMPVPIAAPMMPVEAPKPAGPMKTVMMSAGGDDGGFPIVGWIVPLNGTQAYQTFKLRSGGTKIGTAPPCDIVINDGFMSTEHCQVNASPQGFTLVDGGSTNGCYVNDRKIQGKQDLVDNDMFTLGKTNFKFKSIN